MGKIRSTRQDIYKFCVVVLITSLAQGVIAQITYVLSCALNFKNYYCLDDAFTALLHPEMVIYLSIFSLPSAIIFTVIYKWKRGDARSFLPYLARICSIGALLIFFEFCITLVPVRSYELLELCMPLQGCGLVIGATVAYVLFDRERDM